MPKRTLLLGLFLICSTLLIFTWMVRDSLCELHFRQRKQSWRQCWLTKQNVSGMGGERFPRHSKVVTPQRTLINGPRPAGHCFYPINAGCFFS